MLAGGAAWQPACPAHPCLQPRRLRGCKLGKGSSMRTAICAPGAVPRRVRGIISPPPPRQDGLLPESTGRADLTHGQHLTKKLGHGVAGR